MILFWKKYNLRGLFTKVAGMPSMPQCLHESGRHRSNSPAASFPRRRCCRPSPRWRRALTPKKVWDGGASEMAAGAAGAEFIGASTCGDQGGVPVSGWRWRSVPDARRSGVWGWPERAPRCIASHLMP
jgi:hypothetical protein